MLNNRIVLSTLSALFLSSSCLFGMDLPKGEPAGPYITRGPSVKQSAVVCEGVPLDPTAVAVPVVLDLEDRHPEVQEKVDEVFDSLSTSWKPEGDWHYNGNDLYAICGIDDDKFVLHLCRRGQKIIRIMDIGGGHAHKWMYTMMRLINDQPDLPADLKVHLYSLRGEGGPEQWGVENGRCILHEYNRCKIENLSQALAERGIHEPFDLVVSKWTLRHLVEPLRTFKRVVDEWLKLGGFFASDSFFVKVNKDRGIDNICLHSMVQQVGFLQDTKSAFLVNPCYVSRGTDHFILQKTQEGPCQLPFRYDGMEDLKGDVYSKCVTCYTGPHRELSEEDVRKMYKARGLTGSQRLFDFFQEGKFFYRNEGWPMTYMGDFPNQAAEAAPKE